MSTNAIIARSDGADFTGRYLHSDGYPSHALRVLGELVERDGAATVAAKIVYQGNEGGWSTLEGDKAIDRWPSNGNKLIEGYGVAYRKDEEWTLHRADARDFGWTYIISLDRVTVLRHGEVLAELPWAMVNPVSAKAIERKGGGL